MGVKKCQTIGQNQSTKYVRYQNLTPILHFEKSPHVPKSTSASDAYKDRNIHRRPGFDVQLPRQDFLSRQEGRAPRDIAPFVASCRGCFIPPSGVASWVQDACKPLFEYLEFCLQQICADREVEAAPQRGGGSRW